MIPRFSGRVVLPGDKSGANAWLPARESRGYEPAGPGHQAYPDVRRIPGTDMMPEPRLIIGPAGPADDTGSASPKRGVAGPDSRHGTPVWKAAEPFTPHREFRLDMKGVESIQQEAAGAPLTVELADAPPASRQTLIPPLCFGGVMAGTVGPAGLATRSGRPVCEIWQGPRLRNTGRDGGVRWRESDSLLFGTLTAPADGDCLEVTRDLYRQLLRCTVARGFPHLLRVWNFVPRINEGAGDEERYKRFCYGRALAFEEHAPRGFEATLPAATAVGNSDSDELLVYFLSSASPGKQIENSRQVSAFRYPRQYGPRSPRFSRALLSWSHEGRGLLFVSGTASIVGHESQHAGNLEAQILETWRNLEHVCRDAGAGEPLLIRAYVRYREDLAAVEDFARRRLPEGTPLVCVQADICRPELLVEVEGVFAGPGEGAG